MLKRCLYKTLSTRGFKLLVLLFLWTTAKTQSIEDVVNSVTKFYAQKTLAYSYHKKWYINNGTVRWEFKANYYSYEEHHEVFYRLEYFIDGKDFKYDVVKNKGYYGANIMRQESRYYKNYRTTPRDLMDGNDQEYVLNQEGNFKKIVGNENYNKKLLNLSDCYLLELKDTVARASNLPGAKISDKITRYYISKRDGSIIRSFHSSKGLYKTDSVTFNYTYHKADKKGVIKMVNSFIPLEEKNEEERRRTLTDSSEKEFEKIKIMPGFELPDTSGKVHSSGQVKAKYVLIDFWYKNCGPCLINMKNVEEVNKAFKKSELKIIAINTQDSLDKNVKQLIQKFNCNYDWLFNGNKLGQQLNLYAYPTSVIYDTSTREIVFKKVGASNYYAEDVIEFLKNRISKE